jgi:CRISPR-associated protein Cmr1
MKMAKPSPGHALPIAPEYHQLPTAKPRAARGAPETVEIGVGLEIVTPILGGSYQTRRIDDVDVIRAPSVRGHLRFWWRALYAAQYGSAKELYQRESALWGRAATEDGGRSAVELRVGVEREGGVDESEIRLYPAQGQQATRGAYALWPARGERRMNTRTAPRRQPGTQFQLTLRVAGSATDEAEVRNALRAWILFGGYGGRTRRGLGSLNVIDSVNGWLPTTATREALTELFGLDIFAAPTRTPEDVPWFGGAAIHVGTKGPDAQTAWTTALDWLEEFRQGRTGQAGSRAREPGTGKLQPTRPSISNWPEGDKVRRLSTPQRGLRWAHTPRHNQTPAWPRAGFGLPIIGQFQQQSREERPNWRPGDRDPKNLRWNELPQNHPNYGTEPQSFELRWRAGNVEHDRLASPLIVKALPLVDGWFAPCALWLNRAYPANGEVVLRNGPNSQAPFDRLVAAGDRAQFSALANRTSLREAFLDWLHATKQTTVVAP